MDTLHSVLRAIRGETAQRDHVKVFREFLKNVETRAVKPRRRSVQIGTQKGAAKAARRRK
jgi:hypothetical protein